MEHSSRKYFEEPPDFSLVLGGPLFQLFRRFRLGDDATGLVRRRILVIALFSWLPLLLLSLWEGLAIGGKVNVPFLKDVEVHVRFLVALPLLIGAELVVNERMRPVIRGFLDRKLVPEDSMDKLDAAVKSAFRLRNSIIARNPACCFCLRCRHIHHPSAVYFENGHMVLIERRQTLGDRIVVYLRQSAFVSVHLIALVLRLFIWARFLWQVSRIRLNLVPTHPDRAGGLGFLATTVFAFAPILLAHGALLSGMIAGRIFYLGARLPDFKIEMFSAVVILLFMVLGSIARVHSDAQSNQADWIGRVRYIEHGICPRIRPQMAARRRHGR